MAPRWLGARNSAITPISGQRTGIEPSRTTPIAALRRMPSTKKSRACPEAAAMATAMPTPISPLTPCWMLSRRTIRTRKTSTATPRAVQMPALRPATVLATMNAMVGSDASSMPRQPPSCSRTRWRSKVGDVAAGSSSCASSTLRSPSPVTGGRPAPGAQLVPGVVDDLPAVERGEAPAGRHRAPRLDARDPPAAQPDERDRARTVEQLRLERRHRLPRGVDDRLQPAGHGDDLALAAHAHRLAAGARRLGAELLRVDLVVVGGQALQLPGEPPARLRLCHGSSVIRLTRSVRRSPSQSCTIRHGSPSGSTSTMWSPGTTRTSTSSPAARAASAYRSLWTTGTTSSPEPCTHSTAAPV